MGTIAEWSTKIKDNFRDDHIQKIDGTSSISDIMRLIYTQVKILSSMDKGMKGLKLWVKEMVNNLEA